jgi:hypothetical protein
MRDSGAEEGTAALDQTFLETTVYHNRVFQTYAINNLAYLAPVDEVSLPPPAKPSIMVSQTFH